VTACTATVTGACFLRCSGCGHGHFLEVAQKHYDAEGFDGSPSAVRHSVEQFGVRNRRASDAGSFVAGLLGRRWHSLDLVQQLTVFPPESRGRACAMRLRDRAVGNPWPRLRMGYVLDRLYYLYRGRRTAALVAAGRTVLAPCGGAASISIWAT
jgi:hypothetical protein